MRILHWHPNFLSGGAVANSVLGLAEGQVRLGADVAIASATSAGPPLYEPMTARPGVAIIEWEPRWTVRFDAFLLRGVPADGMRRLQLFEPDVVHVHGGFNPDNLWVPRLFWCAAVCSPHGAFHPQVLARRRRFAKRLYLGIERRWLHRHIVAFHALSPFERECIERLLPGCAVYCAPQGPGISVIPCSAVHRTDASNGVVNFLYLGRLDVYTKGLDVLLDAFAEAERQLCGQRIGLTLAGPDCRSGMSWLQHRSRTLGIADRVRFTGPLSSSQVASALADADVYVQLSRHDGFSLSVSEALLAGKPAILSDAVGPASYPEIAALPHVRVVGTHSAESAAAMVEFASHLEELRNAARARQPIVQQFFSWDRIAATQLAIYAQLQNGRLGYAWN